MSVRSRDPKKKQIYNHNWMFHQIAISKSGPPDILRELLSTPQLALIDIDSTELLPTKSSSPDKTLQDADAVFRGFIGGGEHSGAIRFRFLIEHKSRINYDELMPQLLRYQFGLYQLDQEPVVNVLINNGPVLGDQQDISFRDWLEDPGPEFWHLFGAHVIQFNVVTLNLQDPEVQQRLLASDSPVALALYAMGNVFGEFDQHVALDLLRMSLKLDKTGVTQIWLPVLDYLNSYHRFLTISWWEKLEFDATGENKIMSMALSSLELSHEEGFKKGIEKERLELARQMLRDGFDDTIVRKYAKLSENELNNLKNGCSNSD